MTTLKSLTTAGLLLAVAGVALADPSVKLLPAAAKSGASGGITIVGITNGSVITAAQLSFTFDSAKLAVSATTGYTAGPGWTVNDKNVAGNVVTIALSNASGQTTDGTIVTVSATNSGTGRSASSLTLTSDSNIADDSFNQYTVGPVTAPFITGSSRALGGAISGAPSAGPGGVVAVAAGTTLYMLSSTDLTNTAGFAPATLTSTVSGRPAFGTVGGASVVAVGTDDGKLAVFNVGTGASVSSGAALTGSKASTPAIDSSTGAIYVGEDNGGSAATLVRVGTGGSATTATLTGTTVTGAPAVVGGLVVVGTDTAVNTLRVDGTTGVFTPSATIADTNLNAPIVSGGNALLASSTGKVYGVNITTGASLGNAGSLPAGAAPVSDAFYGANGAAVYGGHDGKIYTVTGATPTVDGGTAFTANPIAAEPLVVAGNTFAIDNLGNLKGSDGTSIAMGAGAAKAVIATGSTVGTSSIIAATSDGVVVALGL